MTKRNRSHWLVLLVLLFLLIGAPLLLWLVAICTHITLFIVPMLFWIAIPASLFGTSLFRPAIVGYDPVGIAGWSVAVLFYAGVALILWAVIQLALSLWDRRRI